MLVAAEFSALRLASETHTEASVAGPKPKPSPHISPSTPNLRTARVAQRLADIQRKEKLKRESAEDFALPDRAASVVPTGHERTWAIGLSERQCSSMTLRTTLPAKHEGECQHRRARQNQPNANEPYEHDWVHDDDNPQDYEQSGHDDRPDRT